MCSYQVKPGNIFGRLGQGIGQGLAEQVPKEIERNRLASGLKQFSEKSANLSPMQQYAELLAIPGITPQAIQTFGELAKQQNIRNAYAQTRKGGREREQVIEPEKKITEVKFANLPENKLTSKQQKEKQEAPVRSDEFNQPKIIEENPIRTEVLPPKPWTQERFDDEVAEDLNRFPNSTLDESFNRVKQKEARELAMPEAELRRDSYLRETQDRVHDKFRKQLELKLQKSGPETFSDITGEMQSNLLKTLDRDLKTKPKSSEDGIIDQWTTKALDLAKTKKDLEKFAKRDFLDVINPAKKHESLQRLKSFQKIFAETGNNEEFYNRLKSDLNLSAKAAASIAYPLNKSLQEFVKKIPSSPSEFSFDDLKAADVARKTAIEAEKYLKDKNTSILSLMKALSDKDPFFDKQSFLDQIRDDQDDLGLQGFQKRELEEGVGDIYPNWGDIWLLPIRSEL